MQTERDNNSFRYRKRDEKSADHRHNGTRRFLFSRAADLEKLRSSWLDPRASTFNTGRLDHIYSDPHLPSIKLFLHYGDLADAGLLAHIIYEVRPDEIYNLAAQSHVRVSFDMPEYTGDVTALGTTRLLESVQRNGIKTKYYQALSSEMFGSTPPRKMKKAFSTQEALTRPLKSAAYSQTIPIKRISSMITS